VEDLGSTWVNICGRSIEQLIVVGTLVCFIAKY
jgi:hypothetical protein